ncbi:hypothetical protein SCP_0802870 [Sparassis crispa]|uniref:Uncharacterized protein n=1 Tax=Sparassis crispa TaxID=139825 RepID=A0A401GU57_9APHY|nr:hypothetical protein SCP_0802870 [Sparassis crispa]GBE85765.1 hypothetical protein SCP_0802870 [Sparassis crispa]
MSQYSHLSTPDPEFRAPIPHPPNFSFTGDVKALRERQRQFQAQNRESLAARLPAGKLTG